MPISDRSLGKVHYVGVALGEAETWRKQRNILVFSNGVENERYPVERDWLPRTDMAPLDAQIFFTRSQGLVS